MKNKHNKKKASRKKRGYLKEKNSYIDNRLVIICNRYRQTTEFQIKWLKENQQNL